MVATDVTVTAADQSSAAVGIKEELPAGNYIPVGLDIDTTGRRLIDEIVQLAAYAPNDHFEQYIMPYMNLNPAARQRHQVRVISIGFYRMLKSMHTYKIIKSKSEIAALKDFLDWLEKLRSKTANDGIILIYHEERKFIPYMVLEALKKYSLLDRFTKTVKSFANTLNLAKTNMSDIKSYNLRKLTKVLSKPNDEKCAENVADGVKEVKSALNKNNERSESDQFDGSASVRAKLAFTLALQLANRGNSAEPASSEMLTNVFNAIKPFTRPIASDIKELDTQNENLERQNSFRPVFLNYFKTTLYHRVRAVKFRIVLAEHGFDLVKLNAIWAEQRSEGLNEALKAIDNLKSEDKNELVELLDSYFDPSKTTLKPTVKSNNSASNTRRRNRRSSNPFQKGSEANKANTTSPEFGAGGDKPQNKLSEPDSSTKTPSPKNARSQRRRNARLNSGGPKKRNVSLNKPAPASVAEPAHNIAIAASN